MTHKDLVQHPISRSSSIPTPSASSGLGDRIQLVKEHDARRGRSGLVEHVPDVGL